LIDAAEVVGEIGLIDGGPRTANVIAVRHTEALLFMRRDFLPVLEIEPTAARSMLLLLCGRLRQTTSFLEDAALQALPIRLVAARRSADRLRRERCCRRAATIRRTGASRRRPSSSATEPATYETRASSTRSRVTRRTAT
jgi:CRP-like cAMP-binding protein